MTISRHSPKPGSLSKPQAVLFDWDNTLVNSWPTIHEALNHCLVEMGREPWDRAQVIANSKLSMRDSFPKLFGDDWQRAAEIYQAYYRSVHLERMDPLPGAEVMLQALKSHDVFVAAVSNKRGLSLREEIFYIQWDGYFDTIIGAGDAARDKPHADPAYLALENIDVLDTSSVWFVGDTVVDLQCGAEIGATRFYYGDRAHEDGTLEGVAFDYHITQHQELVNCFAAKEG